VYFSELICQQFLLICFEVEISHKTDKLLFNYSYFSWPTFYRDTVQVNIAAMRYFIFSDCKGKVKVRVDLYSASS